MGSAQLTRRASTFAVGGVVVALALVGCSSSGTTPSAGGLATARSSGSATPGGTSTGAAHTSPSSSGKSAHHAAAGASASGGSSPSSRSSTSHSATTVTSLSAAKASVNQVVMLHALSYNAGKRTGIPAAQIPRSATALVAAFTAEIKSSTMLPPPAGSAAARLVASLRKYEATARELAHWDPAAMHPMTPAYWSSLRVVDQQWLAAVTAIGRATSQNITGNMAPLLYGR